MASGVLYTAGVGFGALELTLTGSVDLTSNQALRSYIVLSGSLGSPANVTIPQATLGHLYMVRNASGATVTVKVSGGTGIAVANGKSALLICGATDIERLTADA